MHSEIDALEAIHGALVDIPGTLVAIAITGV